MKILTIDTATQIATICITQNNDLIGEITLNCDKNHSEVLMPTIKQLFDITKQDISKIDYIACVSGPGSFTGLRVGAATAKALAMTLNKKIIAVTTLDSLAYNIYENKKTIIPILDARGGNVFTAFYKYDKDCLKQITSHSLISIKELLQLIKNQCIEPIFVGEAVEFFKDQIIKFDPSYKLADKRFNSQKASSTAILAKQYIEEGKALDYYQFHINYIRKSQAEI